MVICRGLSPGAAANRVITKGIVSSERASIMHLGEEYAIALEKYLDKLLDEDECRYAAKDAGIPLLTT